ncbi:MAG: hypothetical protein JJU35_12965 [Balneolales bacterium]|nr:hypothetical protein [Balneolales bacterium]
MYFDEIAPLILILSLLSIFLVNRILKHKERLAMLEKGIVFPDAPKGGKNFFWARLGFVAFGLFLGIFIEDHFMNAFTVWLGGSLAGLGLLVSYLVFPIESASDPITIQSQPDSAADASPAPAAPLSGKAEGISDTPKAAEEHRKQNEGIIAQAEASEKTADVIEAGKTSEPDAQLHPGTDSTVGQTSKP